VISIYNKYIENSGSYRRARPEITHGEKKEKSPFGLSGLNSILSGLLPDWIDPGDAALLLLLLLLYLESDDEDFLIILAVTAFSLFKKDDRDN